VQAILKAQALREAKEEAEFQKLMTEVFRGMANEDGVMKESHELLTREKHCYADKQAALYKSWERQVYHNIQNQIGDNLSKLSPGKISSKLCESPTCLSFSLPDSYVFPGLRHQQRASRS